MDTRRRRRSILLVYSFVGTVAGKSERGNGAAHKNLADGTRQVII